MTNALLELIDKNYKLKEIDIGQAGDFKAAGLKFKTIRYDAYKLGSVSVMNAKAFLGLMQMKTVIVNPFFIDAPLFSYDSIKVLGNNITYLEMFDTTLNGIFDVSKMESIAELGRKFQDKKFESHWYDYLRLGTPQCKKCSGKNAEECNKWVLEYFKEYIDSCLKTPECNETEKRKKAAIYSDGLLENGGPATDPVKKALGEEKASFFFKKILFATDC